MRGDDLERQDVNSKHSRHRSGTFNGKATPLLMSHKVMFVVLRECVSVGVLVCLDSTCDTAAVSICVHGIVHLMCVILSLRVCMYAFDGQRADIKCQRSTGPANPVCQVSPLGPAATVTGPPTFPKWQTGSIKTTEYLNLATDEQADVSSSAIWAVIVPFHTESRLFAGHLL